MNTSTNRITWTNLFRTPANKEAHIAAVIAQNKDFTGLLYFACGRKGELTVQRLNGLDWSCLYFKAIEATGQTAQWDKVHIVVRGEERGWLSGQC
jgi:hypothetical protein